MVNKIENKKTTLAVFPETRDRLKGFATYKDEAFDEILKRMMDHCEKTGLPRPLQVTI